MRKTVQNLGITLALLLAFAGTTLAQGTKSGTTTPKALNPQPEVPSKPKPKQTEGAEIRPKDSKALNPQPEVPSKPKSSEAVTEDKGQTDPKALNPQPEVPSKPKAKTKKKPPKPPKADRQ